MHKNAARILPAMRRAGFLVVIFSLMLGFVFQSPRSAAQATAILTVNTTQDSVDANAGDGLCADSTGSCSLRAAIIEANALLGPDVIEVPPGTYTLTIPNASPNGENDSLTGDLDVRSALTLRGTSGNPADTIIDANFIDKVISINPTFTPTFSTTISGLTFQNGLNTASVALNVSNWRAAGANGWGGGLDWDAGSGSLPPPFARLTIDNCRFLNNTSMYGDGGGLALWNSFGGRGEVRITRTLVQNNSAPNGGGGGIYIDPFTDVVIADSTIDGNTANHDFDNNGVGGGIIQAGVYNSYQTNAYGFLFPVVITRSTISNNHGTGLHAEGGGIFLGAGGLITDSTISGNTTNGVGGGISVHTADLTGQTNRTVLRNVTITNNHSDNDNDGGELGGGLSVEADNPDEVTLINSLVQSNFTGGGAVIDNISGPLSATSAFNLTAGAAVNIGPLANNGGPTQTHALLPGSAALDSGNNALTSTPVSDPRNDPPVSNFEQRGFARIQTGTVDIGAYEAQAAGPLPPDLVISKWHGGYVFQNQSGVQFKLTVRNIGGTPTSGTVTVSDTLPSSMTSVDMRGDGWNCTPATASCTRSDALAPGAAYPDILLNVNMAINAPSVVSNSASVNGGGDASPSNNGATDQFSVFTTPRVDTQPVNMTVCESANVLDLFTAAGGPGTTMQWQTRLLPTDEWVNIAGQTVSPLKRQPTASDNGRWFRVLFINAGGIAESNAVQLTVNAPTAVTGQPANQVGDYGDEVSFTSSASGRPTPTVQWQSGPATTGPWTNISGATSPTYTFTLDAEDHPDDFYVRALWSNACGTAVASDAAQVQIVQAPDLSISKSHTGSFFQNEIGKQYTLTITNQGSAATSGTVTVVDTLPAGLSMTGLSGSGWSCTPATRTCTRSDALVQDASYPAITVTVNVAADAAASVTNSASVSGGGDINASNNTANDPTTILTSPIISQQPTNQTVCENTSASFSAAGGPNTSLQWQSGPAVSGPWTNMLGRTTSPLSFTATAVDHNSYYRAVFTNPGGTANSSAALLTVNTVPVVSTQPLNVQGMYGSQISVTSAASGRPAPTVQWQSRNSPSGTWNNIPGATSPTYTVTLNRVDHPGTFYVRAVWSNACNSNVGSNSATVEPLEPPDLTINKSHSGSFYQNENGKQYTLTVTNSGEWPTSGTVTVTDTLPTGLSATGLSGVDWTCTLGSLSCSRTDALAAGESYPAITLTVSVAGNATSPQINSANVSGGGESNTSNNNDSDSTVILSSPVVSAHPANQTVCENTSANFNAAGGPNTTLQWQSGPAMSGPWTNMPGRTSSPLSFTAQAVDHSTYYRAVFTNPGGSANSSAALLTVNTNPVVGTHPLNQNAEYGQQVTFTSAASGRPAPTVQWQTRVKITDPWQNVSGATSPSYSFTLDPYEHPESFYVQAVWTNGCATTASNTAMLTVGSFSPPNLTVTSAHDGDFYQTQTGKHYTLTVTNSGGWPTIGTVTLTNTLTAGLTATGLSGTGWNCNPATLTCTRSDALAEGASYPPVTLTVNVAGNATSPQSNTAHVTGGNQINLGDDTTVDTTPIFTSPVISQQPVDQTICEAATAVFTVTAGPNTSIQWESSPNAGGPWTVMTGKTSPTLELIASNAVNGSYFRAQISNPGGSITSEVVQLTMNTLPAISQQPVGKKVKYGESASFSSTATGTAPLSVQWQSSTGASGPWADISGAMLQTYTVTPQPATHSKSVYVRANWSNGCGSTASNPALLDLQTKRFIYLPILQMP